LRLSRSEPGEIQNGVCAFSPALSAWVAMCAARRMSSYDEFVHDPMSAFVTFSGQPLALASAASVAASAAWRASTAPTDRRADRSS